MEIQEKNSPSKKKKSSVEALWKKQAWHWRNNSKNQNSVAGIFKEGELYEAKLEKSYERLLIPC